MKNYDINLPKVSSLEEIALYTADQIIRDQAVTKAFFPKDFEFGKVKLSHNGGEKLQQYIDNNSEELNLMICKSIGKRIYYLSLEGFLREDEEVFYFKTDEEIREEIESII